MSRKRAIIARSIFSREFVIFRGMTPVYPPHLSRSHTGRLIVAVCLCLSVQLQYACACVDCLCLFVWEHVGSPLDVIHLTLACIVIRIHCCNKSKLLANYLDGLIVSLVGIGGREWNELTFFSILPFSHYRQSHAYVKCINRIEGPQEEFKLWGNILIPARYALSETCPCVSLNANLNWPL